MWDLEAYGIVAYIIIIIAIICIIVFAVSVVSGALASLLGVSGVLWWSSGIVIFLIIIAILCRIGGN